MGRFSSSENSPKYFVNELGPCRTPNLAAKGFESLISTTWVLFAGFKRLANEQPISTCMIQNLDFFFGLHSKEVDDLECKNLYTNDFFYFMRVQVTLYWVFSRWENCTDTQQSDYLNYFLHISSTEKNIWYLNPRVGFGLGYPKYFRERVSECTGRYYKWRPYILHFLPLWRPL